ncbi:DUF2243 domain-containing protein [Rhodococcus sp. IEGM 1408]|uniref:DUF2243 domain-containing protein n=1 Tax=Rhodococcus sp. IEGM 1408 TaxID=3082220 RepID=UPI002954D1D2|nr:DUF2243 domain-containing protein [Rhodococcus sp. IEGM 1408]MDV7999944.1 DUF2243 domain-containing protein [Rhodococcus sp. IEGM 1408]
MPAPSLFTRTTPPSPDRRLVLSGFLFGCGIAGAVIDLFVFHLVLQWHHFYDLSTTTVALVTDGFFHGATWLITVWGLFMFADVRGQIRVSWGRWAGGVLTGIGSFQLIDGIVFHKILGIHQIRYQVDLVAYDLVWIASAVLLLAGGLLILWRTAGATAPPQATRPEPERRRTQD